VPVSKNSSKRNRKISKSAVQPKQALPLQRLPSDEQRDSHWYKRPAFLWGLGLGIIGVALSATVFLPRPIVEGGQTLSVSDPSAATFYVGNGGLLPLEKVTAAISICRLGNIAGDCDTYKGGLSRPEWQNHRLLQDEKFPVILSDLLKTGGVVPPNADIAIAVYYQPWFFPITRMRPFRFVSRVVGHEEVWTPTSIE